MLALLEQMVAEDPTRSDSWRLIGRIHYRENRHRDALQAYLQALAVQPDNAAAHFDLGDLLARRGDHAAAARHFQQVMQIAPSSSYAAQLRERGFAPPPGFSPSPQWPNVPHAFAPPPHAPAGPFDSAENIQLAGYEIQTFDGAEDLDRRLNQLQADAVAPDGRWRTFIEFGALYNTNISLTPVSRALTGNKAASFQGFLTPELEWIAFSHGPWRSGPLARGYFTVNEDSFQSLNLASFQGGAFLERDLPWDPAMLIGRVDYVYALDLLDGHRFGERHAATASLTSLLENADIVYAYVTASVSEFASDGADPAVDSLDGPALSAGISRFFQTDLPLLPTWSLGVDIESADTEGADFRYQAANLHGDATLQLTPILSFIPRAGIGWRDYGDFTGPVNRDEFIWRVGGKLRLQCSESLSISAVVGHDRFASQNDQFDTERTEAGIVVTVLR